MLRPPVGFPVMIGRSRLARRNALVADGLISFYSGRVPSHLCELTFPNPKD